MDLGGDVVAKFTYKGSAELAKKLDRLGAATIPTVKKALFARASIIADKIRQNIHLLPEEKWRYLKPGEMFHGVPANQKKDLLDSLGITKVRFSDDGFWNIKVGFDGYGSFSTRKYPKGLPNQLLARSIESGSSVRAKHPFSRPAVQMVKNRAMDAMQEVINEAFERA